MVISRTSGRTHPLRLHFANVILIVERTTQSACAIRNSYRWDEGIVDVEVVRGIGGLTFVSAAAVPVVIGGWRRVVRLYVDHRSNCDKQATGSA